MWEKEFIDVINKRVKTPVEVVNIATVVSVEPLKLSLFSNQVYISGDMLIRTSKLKELIESDELHAGDQVVVFSYNQMRKFVLMDKVV